MNDTIKVDNAEFKVSDTIDTFVTIFRNQGKPASMSISLSGSGAPFASTQKIPAGTLNTAWFEPKRDKLGNVVEGRFQSKFPLTVTYTGLKHGTKSESQLFVNVTRVSERPMTSQDEAEAFFKAMTDKKEAKDVNEDEECF